jgi:hypothetical protein
MKRVCLLVLGLLLAGTRVAEAKGVYLSPPLKDIIINGNQAESSFVLEIGNNNDVPITVDLSVVDFGSMNESGGVAFLSSSVGERKYALASWISLEKNSISIEPNENQKIKLTVINKDSLLPGGHYGAILATVRVDSKEGGDKVNLAQSMATLMYVLKTGGEKYGLMFRNMETKNDWWLTSSQIKLRFENNGNVHVVPRGIVEVKNGNNLLVAKGVINEGSAKILPETFRVLPVLVRPLVWWQWPGIYTIEVYYRYDGKDEFSVFKHSYIYIGKEGIILGVMAAVLVAVLVVLIRRKHR